jgi:hypothetical protein
MEMDKWMLKDVLGWAVVNPFNEGKRFYYR